MNTANRESEIQQAPEFVKQTNRTRMRIHILQDGSVIYSDITPESLMHSVTYTRQDQEQAIYISEIEQLG
ncbi:hypothetical protein NXS19_007372 [Fusarium pseudograminearum]|nr:hypothetical protein NXS19_007372 [Fusarium pseudograminearum]